MTEFYRCTRNGQPTYDGPYSTIAVTRNVASMGKGEFAGKNRVVRQEYNWNYLTRERTPIEAVYQIQKLVPVLKQTGEGFTLALDWQDVN